MKYKYEYIVTRSKIDLVDYLNVWGKDGWKCIQITKEPDKYIAFVMLEVKVE